MCPQLCRFLAYLRGLAQPRDGLPQQPRDVHLREADAVAYLGLGEVLGEPQPQHLALAVAGQHAISRSTVAESSARP